MRNVEKVFFKHLRTVAYDGGEGSGNFNHHGRPGQVGGSGEGGGVGSGFSERAKKYSQSTYKNASKELVEIIKQGKYSFFPNFRNYEQIKKEIEDAGIKLVDSGVESFSHEGNIMICVDPEMSYQECLDVSRALEGRSFRADLGEEKYIEACKEAGTKPNIEIIPYEMGGNSIKWNKKTGERLTDGTPVYSSDLPECILSSEDKKKYPNAMNEDFINEQAKVISSLSDEERKALSDYTAQFAYGSSINVNPYLRGEHTGSEKYGVGYKEETKKSAELVRKATDHPLGQNCTLYRGVDDLNFLGNDKVSKMLSRINKGDMSHAQDFRDALIGKEFSDEGAVSTSTIYDSNYGKRPVQFVILAGKETKGIDVSAVSHFNGGRNEIFGRLASVMGMSMQTENEVVLHPGTKFKVVDVQFCENSVFATKRQQKYYIQPCVVLQCVE